MDAPDFSPTTAGIVDTLAATSLAPQRYAQLGDAMALAFWRRSTPGLEISYQQPGHHTLAFYLRAGSGTMRSGVPGVLQDGQFCSMPDRHASRWQVRGELAFLHLYFMPEQLHRRAALELDCEPRSVRLDDASYIEHAALARQCQALLQQDWRGPDALLRANEAAHDILSGWLRAHAGRSPGADQLRGSLAPAVRRRLAELIESSLDQPLSVGMLAQVACLSEYHFLRLFRVSFGMPPHAWIGMRRIARARELLRHSALPVQQVADACGYADLSHFAHRFRAATGCAPGQYRKAWR